MPEGTLQTLEFELRFELAEGRNVSYAGAPTIAEAGPLQPCNLPPPHPVQKFNPSKSQTAQQISGGEGVTLAPTL